MSQPVKHFYEFGPFRVDTTRRVLWRGGEMVPLSPTVFDLLLALVEHSGRILEKDELMQRLWPDSFVEENNLARNVSRLRVALGEGHGEHSYIETVPKRGYRFVAPVNELLAEAEELVLEKHTRSRIIAEREEEVSPQELAGVTPTQPPGILRPLNGQKPAGHNLRLAFLFGALLVVLAAAGAYLWVLRKPAQSDIAHQVKTLAVLPFKPLVADSRDEALELGMADTLITRLGSTGQIIVRPISAVRRYTDLEQDPIAAGREQKVDAVLDGSIQWDGNRVRVTARLLSVSDGRTLWADTCEEQCADIFAVQDSISEKMAGALALKLNAEERKLLAKRYTSNTEAYQLYMKGRFFWNRGMPEELRKGIDYFNQALEKDPNYALAYAGLADSYSALGIFFGMPPKEVVPKAKEAAVKALEIDDTLAEVHTSLAIVKGWYDWDWSGAEREFKRAIELNSHYAIAHDWYAHYLIVMGRQDESIAAMKRAQELDPLNLMTNTKLAKIFMAARQYDRAIEQLRRTFEIDPNFVWAHHLLWKVYLFKGMYDEAVTEFLKAATLFGASEEIVTALRRAYETAGIRGFFQKDLDFLKELAKRRHVGALHFVEMYAIIGEKDQAFAWLEKAYQERSGNLIYIKVDPILDNLRSDPRFADLLRRIGFPQ